MRLSARLRIGFTLVILWVIATTTAFVIYRITGPYDGARFNPVSPWWHDPGISLDALSARSEGSSLLPDDVIIAVGGVSIREWGENLFRADAPTLHWKPGSSVHYRVLRDGLPLDLAVVLARYPLLDYLRSSWGVVLTLIISLVVALFVFLRKPDEPAARVFFLWAVAYLHTISWSMGMQVSDIVYRTGFYLYLLSAFGSWLLFWGAAMHFVLVFPRMHLTLEENPNLPVLVYTVPITIFIVYLANTWSQSYSVLAWVQGWNRAATLIGIISLVLAMGFGIIRYRSNYDAYDRARIRWVIYACCITGALGVIWMLPYLISQRALFTVNTLGLSLLPIPLAMAAAILRHRLFDIDVIIKRTLVYASLTLTILGVYGGLVVLLQTLFLDLTVRTPRPVIIAASTLLTAVLFNPLHRRMQDWVDRRFYRRRYDAQSALAEFSGTVRSEVDLDRLTVRLQEVIHETLQPESVSIVLTRAPRRTRSDPPQEPAAHNSIVQ